VSAHRAHIYATQARFPSGISPKNLVDLVGEVLEDERPIGHGLRLSLRAWRIAGFCLIWLVMMWLVLMFLPG
jgi:hypothetical protein